MKLTVTDKLEAGRRDHPPLTGKARPMPAELSAYELVIAAAKAAVLEFDNLTSTAASRRKTIKNLRESLRKLEK